MKKISKVWKSQRFEDRYAYGNHGSGRITRSHTEKLTKFLNENNITNWKVVYSTEDSVEIVYLKLVINE